MNTTTKKIILIGVLTILIFIILPLVLINGRYASVMLFSIPFGIGMAFTLLMSVNGKQKPSRLMLLSLIPLALVIASCILIAGEGAICLIIMGVFLLIPYFLGVLIGHVVQDKIWMKNVFFLILVTSIISSGTVLPTYNQSTVVKDEIIINISSKKLWEKLIAPVEFGKSTNFYFKNGVSYPNSMGIKIQNNKKYLKCVCNNENITAPLLDYKENKYFSFSFSDSIATMKETNFYNESQTMHLRSHFLIEYGKFEIVEMDSTICKLIATTSFKHKFEPEFYTNFWAEYFVHNVHKHVLEAIKKQVNHPTLIQ